MKPDIENTEKPLIPLRTITWILVVLYGGVFCLIAYKSGGDAVYYAALSLLAIVLAVIWLPFMGWIIRKGW